MEVRDRISCRRQKAKLAKKTALDNRDPTIPSQSSSSGVSVSSSSMGVSVSSFSEGVSVSSSFSEDSVSSSSPVSDSAFFFGDAPLSVRATLIPRGADHASLAGKLVARSPSVFPSSNPLGGQASGFVDGPDMFIVVYGAHIIRDSSEITALVS